MRLSDYIGKDVLDIERNHVGRVHDVEMVADGPELGPLGPSFRVRSLVVGRGSLGARLGLDRDSVRGPWLLKRLFGRRRLLRIPFEDVERVADGTLLVQRASDEIESIS